MTRFAAVLCVAAAMLAFAATAWSADTYTCDFNGPVTTTPPIPAWVHDPALLTSIETGTAHLAAAATCVHVDSDVGQAGFSAVYPASLTADMNYASRVCGTTQWTTPISPVTLTGTPLEGSLTFKWSVSTSAYQGGVTITDVSGERPGGQGAGWVVTTPSNGNCVTTDVSEFNWTGSFSILI